MMDMTGITLNQHTGFTIAIRQAESEFSIIRRTWRERLFTRPWLPLKVTKTVDHPEAVKRNKKVWRMGSILHVTPQMEKAIRLELGGPYVLGRTN